MNYKVCILSAGTGTRMGQLGQTLNKGIFPFKGKAIISHIIEKFPINTDFVFAVGYKKEQIKDYLKIAHPDRFKKFKFVNVTNYKEKGSGPGLSLFKCKKFLKQPFYFVPCDTLVLGQLPKKNTKNWVGIFKASSKNSLDYCNFEIDKHKVQNVHDKKKYSKKNMVSFNGVMHIRDTKIFWKDLSKNIKENKNPQIYPGFKSLIVKQNLLAKKINCLDLGTEKKYKNENQKYNKFDFTKKDETIYFINNKVIKFFSNKSISRKRYIKSLSNLIVFPKCEIINNFYYYKFIKGKILYKIINPTIFKLLLKFLEKSLWKKKAINSLEFEKSCNNFYYKKTIDRINLFKKKYPNFKIKKINKKKTIQINNLLKKINWKNITNGVPSFIHGDLQFDNIVLNNKNSFKLIDWRHSFDKLITTGDLYYDLSKMYGGLIIDYSEIKNNNFKFKEKKGIISIDLTYKKRTDKLLKIYENYILNKKLDLNKVKIMTGLIYLNMAALHEYPFDKFLFAFGTKLLNSQLNDK